MGGYIITVIVTSLVMIPLAHKIGYEEGRKDQKVDEFVRRMQERPPE